MAQKRTSSLWAVFPFHNPRDNGLPVLHTKNELSTVKELLDTNVPSFLSWAKAIIKLFL